MFRVPVVDIYVTGACNLACRYCFGELDTNPGIERSVFLRALAFSEFAGATALEYCGGEPLLYKDLEWAVKEAQGRGFKLILRTNGILLHKSRSFVAKNFDSVGISLDGDATANDLMRPSKGSSKLTTEQKLEIPLQEIAALKELNPELHVLLASVATRRNRNGLKGLARVLVDREVPLDLWKVHQFVGNHFRAKQNYEEFFLPTEEFDQLKVDLAREVRTAFPLLCRKSDEVDGSCLIIDRNGAILLGGMTLGDLGKDPAADLCAKLRESGFELAIGKNCGRRSETAGSWRLSA